MGLAPTLRWEFSPCPFKRSRDGAHFAIHETGATAFAEHGCLIADDCEGRRPTAINSQEERHEEILNAASSKACSSGISG